MEKNAVSRCMSTQHPDNVNSPFFSDSEILAGETEIKETYYVFSHLDIREQMWDCEGKEVDNHVVEKLLSRYPKFFAYRLLSPMKQLLTDFALRNVNCLRTQLEFLHFYGVIFEKTTLYNKRPDRGRAGR